MSGRRLIRGKLGASSTGRVLDRIFLPCMVAAAEGPRCDSIAGPLKCSWLKRLALEVQICFLQCSRKRLLAVWNHDGPVVARARIEMLHEATRFGWEILIALNVGDGRGRGGFLHEVFHVDC